MSSPFDVLGVGPDADEEELTRAYRRRVKEAHPDQGGSTEEFLLVQAAYEAIRTGTAMAELPPESAEEASDPATASVSDEETDRRERQRQRPSRVEYLDYEVLDDFGWGLGDDDLFEKAAAADLDHTDYGKFLVRPEESLLEAAENRGFAWPFACRGGACANCAVAVIEGDIAMPVNHILPDRMLDRGFRLSCNGVPLSDELKVVFNVKHLPGLDELRLPPHPFRLAHSSN